MVRVRALILDYCVEEEAKRKTLREQVTTETAQVDALAATISCCERESQLLQEEYSHVSSMIATGEAKCAQVQQALADHCPIHKDLTEHLQGLESSKKVVHDEHSELLTYLEAHYTESSARPLSDAELEAKAQEQPNDLQTLK